MVVVTSSCHNSAIFSIFKSLAIPAFLAMIRDAPASFPMISAQYNSLLLYALQSFNLGHIVTKFDHLRGFMADI